MTSSGAALSYPAGPPPAVGAWSMLRPGLYWLRQRLPFDLDHINVYGLVGEDGLSAVDTGINSRSSKETWQRFIEEVLQGGPVVRLIGTHLHPDHIGLAGWFARDLGAPLWMTRTEYLLCRILVADTGRTAPDEGVAYYRRAGFDEEALERYRSAFGGFGRIVAPLPESFRRLMDGDEFEAGGRDWKVVVGAGHSPEHACLFDEADNVMMSGDQILPRISSNVSVWPTEPDANPLDDWLRSCHRLRDVVDDETLICPAHGEPFTGGPARLTRLIDGHQRRLEQLLASLEQPLRAIDVANVLFPHANADNRTLAIGETIAHLNYLLFSGAVRREEKAGIHWYGTH